MEYIKKIYWLQGYFSVSIRAQLIDKLDLIFNINEGSASKALKIIFFGNTIFNDMKLEKIITTKQLYQKSLFFRLQNLFIINNYNYIRILYDKVLLQKLYLEHGYLDFNIKSFLFNININRKIFFIRFIINEGLPYYINDINVISNIFNLKIKIIKDLLPINVGDFYCNNIDEIKSFIKKSLQKLGVLFPLVTLSVNKYFCYKLNQENKILINIICSIYNPFIINNVFITGDKANVEGIIMAGAAEFKEVIAKSATLDQRL